MTEECAIEFEEISEEIRDALTPRQPFDADTRPFDVYECKMGWGVVLPGSVSGRNVRGLLLATREEALAFVAKYAPRNG
jgi:hypothetical protein